MADPAFLRDLAVVFLVAAVTTIVFYRLKLPVILGYIVAGILISPNTSLSWLFASTESVETISQIGLIFLLFALGLEWSLGAVRKLGWGLLLAAPVEVGLMLAGAYGVGRVLGFGHAEAVLFGAALAISSTVIITKTLLDQGELNSSHGRTALGVNVVEDLIAVALISLVSGFTVRGVPDVLGAMRVLGVLLLFVALTVMIGYVVVPRVVAHVARFHVSDVAVVVLVGIAFALALLAQELGFAAAFGAFLAGFLMAGSERLDDIRSKVEPLRDVFGSVFFVSVGMLVDLDILRELWPLVAVGALTVIVWKPLSVATALVLTGRGGFHAMRTGIHLIPIGEMGFIIAGAAVIAGYDARLPTVVASVAVVTALVGPLVARRSASVTTLLERLSPRPLVRFTKQYASWSERLARRSMPDPGYRKAVRRRMWRIAIDIGLILLLFAGVGILRAFVPSSFPLGRGTMPADVALFGLAAVLALPIVVSMYRTAKEAQTLVAEGMVPERFWKGDREVSVVARVIRDTVGAAILILAAVLVLLALLPLAPAPPVVVVFGLLLLGAMFLFFDAASALHKRLAVTIESAFTAHHGPQADAMKDLLAAQYPWGVVFEAATLPKGSPLAGRPIGELRVREETGATVVSIKRGERVLVNPGPGEMLVPDDEVLLGGEPAQVVRARDLLAGHRDVEAPLDAVGARTMEAQVSYQSPLAGKRLKETHLRKNTGAVILAIVREGRLLSHPDASEILRPGDRLLLVGTGEQLDKAKQIVSGEKAA